MSGTLFLRKLHEAKAGPVPSVFFDADSTDNSTILDGATQRSDKLGSAVEAAKGEAAKAISQSLKQSTQLNDGEVRIGYTTLFVPPSKISIEEQRLNTVFPGLRTNTPALVKTGRGSALIKMDIVFPDRRSVNKEMREIVAQFRSIPIIPIESQYIINAVIRKDTAHNETVIERNKVALNDSDFNLTTAVIRWLGALVNISKYMKDNDYPQHAKRTKSLDKMVRDGRSWTTNYSDSTKSGTANTDSIEKLNVLLLRAAQAVTTASIGGRNVRLAEDEAGFDDNILKLKAFVDAQEHTVRVAIEAKLSSSRNINQVIRSDLSEFVQSLPVALKSMDVSPIQDHVDAFQMHLEMYVFNIAAYTIFPRFLSDDGNPTPDFMKTGWLRRWMSDRYLDGVQEPRRPHRLGKLSRPAQDYAFISFQYPTSEVSVLKIEDQGFNLAESRLSTDRESLPKEGTGFVQGGIRYMARYQTLTIDPSDAFVKFETFNVRAQNKLAIQPVLATLYPTYQHMGRANAVVTMSFIITGAGNGSASVEVATDAHDKWMRKFHTMKREVDEVTINHGPGIRRRAFINIDHDALHLMGIKAAYLDDVYTETLGPATSRITIRLIEFLHDQDSLEQISPVSGDQQSEKATILKHVTDRLQLLDSEPDNNTARMFDLVRGIVYGKSNTIYSDSQAHGIITPRLLARVFQLQPSLLLRLWQQVPSSSKFLSTRLSREEFVDFEEQILKQHALFTISSRLISNWGINGRDDTIQLYQRGNVGDVDVRRPFTRVALLQFFALTSKPDRSIINAITSILEVERDKFVGENSRLDTLLNNEFVMDLFGLTTPQTSKGKRNPQSSYPDLFLPTYGEVFALILDSINTRIDRLKDSAIKQITDLDSLNAAATQSQAIRNLMKNIFPTYRELGVIPPYGKWNVDDFARGPGDIVDPDFYWARQSSIDPWSVDKISKMLQGNLMPNAPPNVKGPALKQLQDDIDKAGGLVLPNSTVPTFSNFIKSRSSGEIEVISRDLAKAVTTDSTGELIAQKTPTPISQSARREMPTEALEITHPENARQLFETTVAMQKDDQWRMSRAYPTVRLLFIKPSKNIGGQNIKSIEVFADELFGYNALQSVRVTRHKFYPDVAEIELINVTGNLDPNNALAAGFRKRSLEEIAAQALTSPGKFNPVDQSRRTLQEDPVPARRNSESSSQFAQRIQGRVSDAEKLDTDVFFVQEGMMIQIRMGYDGNVKDLPVVFNGQIAEVKYGDVIRIVAQSHASELTTPVSFYGDNTEATFLHAAFVVMAQSPAAHYGPAPRIKDQGGLSATITNIFGADSVIEVESELDSRRLENLFIPKQGFLLGREFAIPMISGLEVLHEISRLIPGFICLADVPYGTRQTAFLGFASQYYFAFPEDAVREELVRWSKDVELAKAAQPTGIRSTILKLVSEFASARRLTHGIDSALKRSGTTNLSGLDTLLGGRENVRIAFGYLAAIYGDPSRAVLLGLGGNIHMHVIARMYGWNQVLEAIMMDGAPKDEDDFNSQVAGVLASGQGVSTRAAQIGDIDKLFGNQNPNSLSARRAYADSFRLSEDESESIEDLLEDHSLGLRIILMNFLAFLADASNGTRELRVDGNVVNIRRLQEMAEKRTGIMRHPRMRPFRRHHYANSLNHIIANNIYATRDEMANVIIMRHPNSVKVTDSDWDEVPIQIDVSTTWETFRIALDRKIPPEDQKFRVVTENNVEASESIEQVHLAGYANLAQAVRPMYRGELILRGNPEIKPYDLVWIDDKYNSISGPVDVESVTHHFTNEFGFVTTVTPHAVVFPNAYSDYSQARAQGLRMAFLVTGATVATAVAAMFVPIAGAYIASVVTSAGVIGGTIAAENKFGPNTSFWDLFTGDFQTESDKKPVSIIPLQLRGAPWTAGMIGVEGWNRYRVSEDQREQFQVRGTNIRWEDLLGISSPQEDYFRNFG